jgi:propionyl-CoA synthetase
MENIFDISRGDVWFSASDIGWVNLTFNKKYQVVGHSFIVYGPLIRGATSVLFEGKPIVPNAGALWRVV